MSTLPLRAPSAVATGAEAAERAPDPPFGAALASPSRVRDHRLVGTAVVLFIVLLQATSHYLFGHERARILGHLAFLAVELPCILVALSFTYNAMRRHQVDARSALGINVLVAGTLGAGFGVLLYVASLRFPMLTLRPVANFTVARGALYGFSCGQFHMGLWALAFAYPFAMDEARIKALEATQLRTAAELARLRAHLEPHFLLNTLNAIAGLVTDEPREARRLIGCLGDLLRDALHDDDELQSVRAQIAWLQRYAAILSARHAGQVTFAWDVAPDTESVLLPRLLLQPLVENAVKHGALHVPGGGLVSVRARWRDGTLVCTVEDDGPGRGDGEVRPGAFGLRAVIRRVELKYPGARVVLEPLTESPRARVGTRARVEIPRAVLDAGNATPLLAAKEARS